MCSIEIKDDDALVRNASSRLSLDGVFVVVVAIDIVNNGSSKLAHVMASVTIAQQGSSNQHVSDLLVN